MVNSGALVDSYSSANGPYGGTNVGSNGDIVAAGSITNNGGVIRGQQITNQSSDMPMPAIPPDATILPAGSTSPGGLYINTDTESVTLAPGVYVVKDLNVNYPGAISISPAGPVTIFVTESLNLGGNENPSGAPANLTFIATYAGWVNVNANGTLVGNIYAPTSTVNVNSTVDGYIAGNSVTLNSGAAIHYDTAETCPPPTVTTTTPPQLPPPPNVRGCYVGTWNGWAPAPCARWDQLPAAIQGERLYIGGGQVYIPDYLDGAATSFGPISGITSPSGLKFGQVVTTFVDVVSDSAGSPYTEVNTPPQSAYLPGCSASSAAPTPNDISVQANTNNFPAVTGDAFQNGDKAWVQFALQSTGFESADAGFRVCIWNNDFTQGKQGANYISNPSAKACSTVNDCDPGYGCVSVSTTKNQCLAPTYWADCLVSTNYGVGSAGFNLALQKRQFQTLDYASVAGSAFKDGNDGGNDLGLVVAMSWFDADPATNNNDYRGLYAVVTKDRYGLGESNNWTTVSGTVLGLGNCGIATFPQGTMVYTSVEAGNCATQGTPPPDVPPTVTWPGVCQNTLTLSSSPAPSESTASITDESNNLNIIPNSQSTLGNTSDGNNYLEMHYLASTDGKCVNTPRVYVKDHAQDHGSIPSNLGGEAFWESPDIIVVPTGPTVTATTPAGDPTVIAGKQYNLYVRVHNDYACASVYGVRTRVWWGDATLANTTWTDVITNGPDSGNPHWSASKILSVGDNLDIIGPIPWTAPSGVTPHQCLLVNIQANGESAPTPTNISNAPNSYQVAQRNIEIGNACGWTLKNGNKDSLLSLSLTTTDGAGQSYLVSSSDAVTATFDDSNGTLYTGWSSSPHPGCTLSQPSPDKTMITMSSGVGRVTVKGASIAANALINVSASVIPALYSGTTIGLQIATYLTNGGLLNSSPTNGATCSGTADTGSVPIQ
jgi:hypothetical protein